MNAFKFSINITVLKANCLNITINTSMNDIIVMAPFNGFDELENVVSERKGMFARNVS